MFTKLEVFKDFCYCFPANNSKQETGIKLFPPKLSLFLFIFKAHNKERQLPRLGSGIQDVLKEYLLSD